MSAWAPVKRTTSEVQAVERNEIRVVLRIDREPEHEWRRFFAESMGESAKAVSVSVKYISAHVPDDELDALITRVDASIVTANRRYEEEAVPELQAHDEADRIKAEESDRRWQAARNVLDQHGG